MHMSLVQRLPDVRMEDHHFTSSVGEQAHLQRHSVEVESAVNAVNLPITCLEGMWTKAPELLSKHHAIVPAPGQSPEAKMVLSYSGKCRTW